MKQDSRHEVGLDGTSAQNQWREITAMSDEEKYAELEKLVNDPEFPLDPDALEAAKDPSLSLDKILKNARLASDAQRKDKANLVAATKLRQWHKTGKF